MAKQRADILLDRLDVSVADHMAPGSVARAIMNLCPLGPVGNHYWSPVNLYESVNDVLTGVLSIGMQVRQRYGALADPEDPNASLERVIAVTADKVYLLDPLQTDENGKWKHKEVYTFAYLDESRRAQFCQIGENTFIATSRGGGLGKPDELLVLIDDKVFPYVLPEPPIVAATFADSGDDKGLEAGTNFSVRVAWLFKDGSIGPAERPVVYGGMTAESNELTFEIVGSASLPAWWMDLISGVAVFLAEVPTENKLTPAWFGNPHFHVATIPGTNVGASVKWKDKKASILSYPRLEDDNMALHNPRAAACMSYNKQLILGDVAYDLYRPSAAHNVFRGDHGTGTHQIRFGVTLKTMNGTVERIGPALQLLDAEILLANGAFIYPDRRAVEVRAYVLDGATWYLKQAWKMSPTPWGNMAWADTGITIDTSTHTSEPMPDVAEVNGRLDHDVNRMLTSDVYQPFSFPAARAQYIGNGPLDGIVGFATNALPISEGQFGDYPLYVLGRESVHMGRVGDTTAWAGFEVVSKRGCVGRMAFCNVDNVIAFASRDGIWLLSPGLENEPVSAPLHYNNNDSDFFACLGHLVALGFYNDRTRGRRELWVSSGKITFAYSFMHQRWFLMDRQRVAYCLYNNVLLGASGSDGAAADGTLPAGVIYNEGVLSDPVRYYVRTARQYFNAHGFYKRLKWLGIRQRNRLDTLYWRIVDLQENGLGMQVARGVLTDSMEDIHRIQVGMLREPYFEVWGEGVPGQGFEGFSLEYEIRHRHRPSVLRPVDWNPGDPYSFNLVEIPWDCVDGFDWDVIANRPPYFVLDDVLWLPIFDAPYCEFDDVTAFGQNVEPWFAWTDEVLQETQWNVIEIAPGEEDTAPYCEFDDVTVAGNAKPYFVLDEVTAQLPEPGSGDPGAPNVPPTISGPDNVVLYTDSTQTVEYLIEDPDGQLEYVSIHTDRRYDLDLVQVFGSDDGVAWQQLPVIHPDFGSYHNTTHGWKMKKVMVRLRGSLMGVGTFRFTIQANDDAFATTLKEVTVTINV